MDQFSKQNRIVYDQLDYRKYGKIWSQYTDEKEAKGIVKYLETYLNGNFRCGRLRVLDIGCGSGYLINNLLLSGIVEKAYGLDISYIGLLQAAKMSSTLLHGFSMYTYVQGNVYELPFHSDYFDMVIGNGILHHLDDLPGVMREIKRVLAWGGVATFIEPTDLWVKLSPANCSNVLSKMLNKSVKAGSELASAKKIGASYEPHEPELKSLREHMRYFVSEGLKPTVVQFHVLAGLFRALFISRIMRLEFIWPFEQYFRCILKLVTAIDFRYFTPAAKGFYYSYTLRKMPQKAFSGDFVVGVEAFIKKLWDENDRGFRSTIDGKPNLLATTYAAHIYSLLGSLNKFSDSDKKAWCRLINLCQRQDGYFDDKNLRYPCWSKFEESLWLLLQTALAVSALATLGASPKNKLNFLNEATSFSGMTAWFRSLKWKRHGYWNESIRTECIAVCLHHDFKQKGQHAFSSSAFQAYFAELGKLQNPVTGLWGSDKMEIFRKSSKSSLYECVGTTFHIVDIYAWANRPIPKADLIIKNTSELQHPDGLFAPDGFGGNCIDLDSISILGNLSHIVPKLRPVINRAMKGFLDAVNNLKLQNPDGGFRNTAHGQAHQKDKATFVHAGQSDLLSTWFRTASIAIAEKTIDPEGAGKNWKFDSDTFLHFRNEP